MWISFYFLYILHCFAHYLRINRADIMSLLLYWVTFILKSHTITNQMMSIFISNSSSLQERSFSTLDFYRQYEHAITPAGLRFFQSRWDLSVQGTYHNTLSEYYLSWFTHRVVIFFVHTPHRSACSRASSFFVFMLSINGLKPYFLDFFMHFLPNRCSHNFLIPFQSSVDQNRTCVAITANSTALWCCLSGHMTTFLWALINQFTHAALM